MVGSVLDLFSGIGGFTIACHEAGLKTNQFVEIDPFCQQVLKKNWPDIPIHDDISTFNDSRQKYNIIVGGFPCQDISIAGTGEGLKGERSGLWKEYLRLINKYQPQYVVIENVKRLLSLGLEEILSDLAQIGYDAEWETIPAALVGLPQARERVWIVAYPSGFRRERLLSSEDISEARQRWKSRKENLQSFFDFATVGTDRYPKPIICGVHDRPSDWAHRLKCCGNAVAPDVAFIIMDKIKKELYGR